MRCVRLRLCGRLLVLPLRVTVVCSRWSWGPARRKEERLLTLILADRHHPHPFSSTTWWFCFSAHWILLALVLSSFSFFPFRIDSSFKRFFPRHCWTCLAMCVRKSFTFPLLPKRVYTLCFDRLQDESACLAWALHAKLHATCACRGVVPRPSSRSSLSWWSSLMPWKESTVGPGGCPLLQRTTIVK